MEEGYEKYLEEQYEGNVVQKYKQKKDDEQKAFQIAKEAEDKQNEAIKDEVKRIINKEEVTQADIDKVLEDYASNNDYAEYLVDGARLKCNQATLEPFTLPDESEIVLELGNESAEISEKRKEIVLSVSENLMKDNDKPYATVADYVLEKNIFPFNCNCLLSADRNSELSKIMNDPECSKHGVCRHLIRLNNEWENYSLGRSYLSKYDDEPPYKKDGITMTSMLFCSHGGLITPLDSGQSFFYITMEIALQQMDLYLEGNLSEDEAAIYIQFVAQKCGLKIATIGEGELKGKDKERYFDDYIIAWTYYWNLKIDEGVFGDNKIPVRTDVVKAMIMEESQWGAEGAKNSARDVMQCLVPGDYALWILSGYNPKETVGINQYRYHDGQDEKVVCVKDGTEYKHASMRTDFNFYTDFQNTITTTSSAGFGEGLGILKNNVVTIIDNPVGELKKYEEEYLIYYDRETPNMSIACGVGYLAYCEEHEGSEKGGVRRYNGGGEEGKTGIDDSYVKSIDENLKLLEHEDYEVEPLKD